MTYRETLRRLGIVDEEFAGNHAGLFLGLGGAQVLDPRVAALVRLGALLAVAPVIGLGRVVAAAQGVAGALKSRSATTFMLRD